MNNDGTAYSHPCPKRVPGSYPPEACNVHYIVRWSNGKPHREPHDCRGEAK